ncbi:MULTISPECIES: hypothetical protein [Corynebacterium]|uniref:hypothetical protein n=1 Tax=Corynebacterium TaxID=1716 RepID=UPI001EF16EBB|nr:hypothetical protein [Corynebacterium kefirresidentii]MCG7449333.1 hypothetical protein [Corynebacterium kefirresidentii]MCG7452438.1 hypothetical protein [Corynebacterium kefirresidentii]
MGSSYENHIHQLIEWHLSDTTGSKYWINRRESGWTKEVVERWFLEGIPPHNHRLLEHDLRNLSVELFIPKGVNKEEIVGVFESGGTTGEPKRVVLGFPWMHELLEWSAVKMIEWGHTPGRNWLVAVPTGPHVVGELSVNAARKEGAFAFRIDVDPRWAKNTDNNSEIAHRYSMHLVEQMRSVLLTQNIGCLVSTPPILLALTRDSSLVDLINENNITIRWGGLPFDRQSEKFLKERVFPHVPFFGVLGNTMTLGFGIETDRLADKSNPFTLCSPVNKAFIYDTKKDLFATSGVGEIAYSHASKTHLYPPSLDRDSGRVTAGKDVYLKQKFLQKEGVYDGVY